MSQGSAKGVATVHGLIDITFYTADDTWTKADYPNATTMIVHCIGSGGGGGGVADGGAGVAEAAGGGGGAYSRNDYDAAGIAALGATESIQVGVAGSGGAAGHNIGADGENTLFDDAIARGGDGGAGDANNASNTQNEGGPGGIASGGDVNVDGSAGGYGTERVADGAAYVMGFDNYGGAAAGPWGGGTIRTAHSFAIGGDTGQRYGGGGSGARSNDGTDYAGGDGTDGLVVIEMWRRLVFMSQGFAKASFADPGWQDWSPSYTNLTIGDGTVIARYIHIGTLVHAYFHFVLGSTSVVGTGPRVSVPLSPNTNFTDVTQSVGTVLFRDDSLSDSWAGTLRIRDGVDFEPMRSDADLTYTEYVAMTSSTPITWATSDVISFSATYEAAASALIDLGANDDHGSLSGLTDDDHSFYPKGVLAYAETSTSQTGMTADSTVDLTDLTLTVTPDADRYIRIIAHGILKMHNANQRGTIRVREGSTELGRILDYQSAQGNEEHTYEGSVVLDSPTSASHTYKLTYIGAETPTGDADHTAASTALAWIMVEDIGSAL